MSMSDLIPMKTALQLPLAIQTKLTEHQLRRWRDNGLLPVIETRNGPKRSRYFVQPETVEALIQSQLVFKTIHRPYQRSQKKLKNQA